MKKLIIYTAIILGLVIFAPIPNFTYSEGSALTLYWDDSLFTRYRMKTSQYPEFGFAPDFSWVSGKIGVNRLEGGCTVLIFDNKQTPTPPYYGRLAISKEDATKFDLFSGKHIIAEGKLGANQFSMACPSQSYDIENIKKL